ncbi:PcfJ domain-containing protein [Erysipelothrix anatis]|uniref:PcfJ domain-containing protein n=1 Tax=Erysipelothrix anatis TaxID=2683713 RepID=UPI00135B95D1|nr:PcfJ domain-containing protein [Erysipelothrix anatis]
MNEKELFDNRLPLPKDFKNWVESHFESIIFKRKGELIATTSRTDRERVLHLRSNTNFIKLEAYGYFGVYVSNRSKIEYQTWRVEKRINQKTLKEFFEYTLWNMTVMQNDEILKIHHTSYGWYAPGTNATSGMGGWMYTMLYRYEHNHKQLVENSPLYRIPYELFGNTSYEHVYEHRKNLYLTYKNGSTKMFDDILNNRIDYRILTKKRITRHWKIIAAEDMSFLDYRFYLLKLETGIDVVKEARELIPLTAVKTRSKSTNWVKLQNYLIKQNKKISYYDDYIGTMNELEAYDDIDLINYPKDLEVAHDKAVTALNLVKVAKENSKVKEVAKKLKTLEYDGEVYSVVAPLGLADIVQEGKNLSHCVGGESYLKRHSNKEIAIMFVRLKNRKETSLYTFTYHYNHKVSAVHGYGNRDSSNEHYEAVKDFLNNEWLPWVIKTSKQVKKRKKLSNNKNTLTASI